MAWDLLWQMLSRFFNKHASTGEGCTVQVALLAEVVAAWNRSAGARTGIFDASFDAEAFRNSTGAGGDYGALSEGVACHQLWIGYLTEAWQVRVLP